MDLHNGVVLVVGAIQEQLQLKLGELLLQLDQALGDFRQERLVVLLLGQFHHHLEVVIGRLEPLEGFHLLSEGIQLADHLLACSVVVPEVGSGHLFLKGSDARLLPREVKETP